MVQRVHRLFCSIAVALLCSCGSIQYAKQMEETEREFTQAREQKAQKFAPYEYYYAQAYINQARLEAARSLYENAIRYAKTAQKSYSKASEIALERREKGNSIGAIR